MATADDLDTLITQFLRDAEDGRVRAGDLRELRGALAHIGSELGTLPVDEVQPLDVQRVIEQLRRAGLPPARLRSIVEALRSLYAYAIGRGLVRTSPVVGVTPTDDEGDARAVRTDAHTPTEAVLALAGSAVSLLTRTAVVAFVLIVAALVVALI
jgi:site-specific recombinase XerC